MPARIEGPGQIVAGRYRVVRAIGRGGMGEVFLAQQLGLERLVVLKTVLPELHGGDSARALLDEARVAARLQHPNVVSILDVFRGPGTPFVAMEYLAGVSLRDVIERALPGALPFEIALVIALDVLRGLTYAHRVRTGNRVGVVHRDVTPRNVVVTFAGVSKLIDFGISRWLGDDGRGDPGSVTGTHGYMAPEQHEGQPVDGRADQYAAAVSLYQMVAGALPRGPEVTRSDRPAAHQAFTPRADVDPDLGAILRRALSVDPDQRYTDCGAMAAALEHLARERGVALSAAAVQRWMLSRFAREHAAAEAESEGLTAELTELPGPTNLTPSPDRFVGRAEDLAAVRDWFDAGSRLVTLLGPPGIGKTRLAREHGWRARVDYPGGVWFVDLTEAHRPEGVLARLAATLGVPGTDATADGLTAQLTAALAHRGRTLILLDNFEQIASHAAATLGRLGPTAPDAHWLVTSRERLNLPGEIVIEVGPLGHHHHDESLSLLLDRARVVRPDTGVDPDELDQLAAVAARLEGNPLAIELAAGRLRLLSPRQLGQRLATGFEVLAGRRRGVPERQTAFDKAVAWSWQMLEPWEQAALAQASVFRGGFALGAAEAVVDLAAHPDAPEVIDVLESLVDKSLLRRMDSRGEPRFGMFEGIRSFARARLDTTGDATAVRTRHADHFLAYAEAWAERDHYPDVLERAERLAVELDNLWSLVEPVLAAEPEAPCPEIALRAVVTLVPIYEGRGLQSMVARALAVLLDGELAPDAPPAARAAAWLERTRLEPRNRLDLTWHHAEHAVALARDHHLDGILAWALCRAVPMACDRHDLVARDRLVDLALERFAGDAAREWRALAVSPVLMYQKVEPVAPERLTAIVADLDQVAATGQRPAVLAQIHWALGVHHLVAGDLDGAHPHMARVVELYQETGDAPRSLALARGNLAAMYLALDRELPLALALAEQCRRSLLEMGLPMSAPFCDYNLSLIRERLGDLEGAEVEARRCLERQTSAGAGSNWLLRDDAGRVAAAAQLAIALSQLDRVDDAEALLADAGGWAACWDRAPVLSVPVMEAARAILDAARASCALGRGAIDEAAAHLDAARARPDATWSDEVGVILRRAQDRLEAARGAG